MRTFAWPRWLRRLEAAIVAGVTARAAVALARAPAWTVDDAWIVVRYGENLARHGRLAFNLDGAPVEGFTSLSAVLLAALATALHVPAMKVLVATGQVAFLLSGALIVLLGRALRAPPIAAGIVAAAHLTLAEHLTHAGSGLETEPFIALGLALALTTATTLRRHDASVVPLAIVGCVLVTTRPEGAAAVVLAAAAVGHARASAGDLRALRRGALAFAAWFVLPMLLIVGWRFARTGTLVPNTYFAKRTAWNGAHLRDLWALVNEHFLDVGVAAAAMTGAAWLATSRPLVLSGRERRVVAVATLVLLAHSLAYAGAEPLMDYARRFAIHGLPWIDVVALVVLSVAIRSMPRSPRALAAALGLILLGSVGNVAARGIGGEAAEATRTRSYVRAMEALCVPTAAWIVEHTREHATIAVYPDAGCVPQRTNRRTIDFGRLNDARLARTPHSPEQIVAYFFETSCDVLVVSRPKRNQLWDDGAEAIVASPRFRSEYELVLRQDTGDGVGYLVYARRTR